MSEQELARQIAGEIVERNTEPAVRFALEKGEPGIFESKVGGTPYLPRDMAWPMDPRGMGMELLAQVDCAALAGLPDFPHEGLLQFYFMLDKWFGKGTGDQTEQEGFRVLYHGTVDRSVTAEEVQAKMAAVSWPEDRERYSPVYKNCRIVYAGPSVQHISWEDCRAWEQFLAKWNELHGTEFEDCLDYSQATGIYEDFPPAEGKRPFHQLGGYPRFSEVDPRTNASELADLDVLLFQLDSDFLERKIVVHWPDCGIANFFINREALKKRDFSRVLYHWDF